MKKARSERIVPEPPADDPAELFRTLVLVHERLVADRLSALAFAARRESEATQRALAGILLDTLEERDEIERIRAQWQGEDSPPSEPRMDFHDRIESLLEAKRVLARRYRALAAATDDPQLAKRLRRLGDRAGEHAAILLSILGE